MELYGTWVETLAPGDAVSFGFISGFILALLMVLFLLAWLKQLHKEIERNKAERKQQIIEAVKQALEARK